MAADTDQVHMQIALEEAKVSLNEGQFPVGAVVVAKGEIVGRGRRHVGGNAKMDHAEISALRKALSIDPTGGNSLTLYTTLEPCAMCFGAVLNTRIARVVYALEDPYGGMTAFPREELPLRHQNEFPDIQKGIYRDASRELFKHFFQTTENSFWSTHPENPLVQLCLKALPKRVG